MYTQSRFISVFNFTFFFVLFAFSEYVDVACKIACFGHKSIHFYYQNGSAYARFQLRLRSPENVNADPELLELRLLRFELRLARGRPSG